MKSIAFVCALLLSLAITTATAEREVVVYWGQGPDGETDLRDYCQDSTIDILVIAFLHDFPYYPGSNLPGLNIAGHCNKAFSKSDPHFLDCSKNVGPDITYCQQQGKKVMLSIGGGHGNIAFTDDAQATTAADTVWNMFLGGSYAQRPFGSAVLDGIDLDIETGTSIGYVAFINQLRVHFLAQTAKTYLISGAPQCPYADEWLGPGKGTALQSAWFDYVWVQFYNNNCGLDKYPSKFNFATWANWAKTISINPNAKVLIGAPASAASAGSGYVPASTLKTISDAMAIQFPSIYGGIMLWEAGTAQMNNNFAGQLAAFLHDGSAPSTPVVTPVPAAVQTTTTTGSKSSTTTTGRVSSSTTTTGKSTPAPTIPVPAPVISVPTPSIGITPAGSSCPTIGYMKCSTSETYQICDHNHWSTPLSCQTGLRCNPSGNFIYCTY